jgi:hypothetical protein
LRTAKSDLVRKTVLAQVEQFTLAGMSAQLPAASPQLIKKILAELKQARRVRLKGSGRGARWESSAGRLLQKHRHKLRLGIG